MIGFTINPQNLDNEFNQVNDSVFFVIYIAIKLNKLAGDSNLTQYYRVNLHLKIDGLQNEWLGAS